MRKHSPSPNQGKQMCHLSVEELSWVPQANDVEAAVGG